MRWFTGTVLCVLVAAVAAMALSMRGNVDAEHGQAAAQSAQVRHLAAELGSLRGALAAADAKLDAANPQGDVITCADLEALALQNTWGVTVSDDDTVSLEQTPVTLPSHCYKS
jgi:hypothetical protein